MFRVDWLRRAQTPEELPKLPEALAGNFQGGVRLLLEVVGHL